MGIMVGRETVPVWFDHHLKKTLESLQRAPLRAPEETPPRSEIH